MTPPLSIPEQIAVKELEIQILSDILAVGVYNPKLRWSDLCVQRAEAMAALNTLRTLQDAPQCVSGPSEVSKQGLGGNEAQIED